MSTLRTFTLLTLEQNDYATYDQLLDDENRVLCVMLERAWVDRDGNGIGDHDVSCIQANEPGKPYHMKLRETSGHGYPVFEAQDVKGRSNIQMHIGALPRDSKGCMLFGSRFGDVDYGDGKPDGKGYGVQGSRIAYNAFMKRMKDAGITEFLLDVKRPPKPSPEVAHGSL